MTPDPNDVPARPWYVVGQPWAREETTIVGGEPRGRGPKGDPHIYDAILATPPLCSACEDPELDHGPEDHRAALYWTTHCVNQHDDAVHLLARAYIMLRDHWSKDDERDQLLEEIRAWLDEEPPGPTPEGTLAAEQETLADLLDIPGDQYAGICRCGGEVYYSPRDDVSYCTNGCPGGPHLIDQEASP